MSTPENSKSPLVRSRWLRRLLRGLAALAILIAFPVSCELTRWSPLPSEAPAAQSGPAAGGRQAQQTERAVVAWLEEHPVSGVAACVAVAGEVRWCSAHGYADVAERTVLTAATPMRVGSVSKTVTAMLLARLVEQELVDLDQPIGEIAGVLVPEHLSAITLRQLASHTAGIRHYRWRFAWPPHETWARDRHASVSDSLELFLEDELLFEPGAGFQYSTHGYSLLGAVIERASGSTFHELFEREIVGPFGLQATTLETSEDLHSGGARPYEVVGGRYRHAMRVDNSRMWPGGGVRSSARDLARWGSALSEGELIDSGTFESFLQPQALQDGSGNPQNYALGWRIAHTSQFLGGGESYRVAHHGGVASGGSAFLALFPDHSLAVSVLTNTRTGSGALIPLAFDLAEPFMARLVEGAASSEG